MQNRKITFFRRLYDTSIKHWIWASIVPLIPGLFILISVFGRNLGLKDIDNNLYPVVYYVSLPIFLISILFTFLKSSADKWNENSKYKGQKVLGNLNSSLNALKEYKYRRFINYIQDHPDDSSPFHEITKPRTQIELILDNFRTVLSQNFGIESDNIGVSVLIKKDGSDWEWMPSINLKEGLQLNDLISNDHTTAYQIIHANQDYMFFPDKREAITKNKYVPDTRDKSCENIGSIFCGNISIDHNKLQAVFSISSYGEQFCTNKDTEAIYLITKKIFPTYERRLKVELALLYIKEVMAT